MIDLKKIQCLNNNNEIKKFLMKNKIDKPLYLGNYLFHYLIIFNNLINKILIFSANFVK